MQGQHTGGRKAKTGANTSRCVGSRGVRPRSRPAARHFFVGRIWGDTSRGGSACPRFDEHSLTQSCRGSESAEGQTKEQFSYRRLVAFHLAETVFVTT